MLKISSSTGANLPVRPRRTGTTACGSNARRHKDVGPTLHGRQDSSGVHHIGRVRPGHVRQDSCGRVTPNRCGRGRSRRSPDSVDGEHVRIGVAYSKLLRSRSRELRKSEAPERASILVTRRSVTFRNGGMGCQRHRPRSGSLARCTRDRLPPSPLATHRCPIEVPSCQLWGHLHSIDSWLHR